MYGIGAFSVFFWSDPIIFKDVIQWISGPVLAGRLTRMRREACYCPPSLAGSRQTSGTAQISGQLQGAARRDL